MPKQKINLIFCALLSTWATGAHSGLEENLNCEVPGITARWQAAYCMAKNSTDDYENDGVTACLLEENKTRLIFKDACEANAYWKKKICFTFNDDKKGELCFKNPKNIPNIVKFGVGS